MHRLLPFIKAQGKPNRLTNSPCWGDEIWSYKNGFLEKFPELGIEPSDVEPNAIYMID